MARNGAKAISTVMFLEPVPSWSAQTQLPNAQGPPHKLRSAALGLCALACENPAWSVHACWLDGASMCLQVILEAMTAGLFTAGSGVGIMPVMQTLTRKHPRAAIELLTNTCMQPHSTFYLERVSESHLLPSLATTSSARRLDDCKVRTVLTLAGGWQKAGTCISPVQASACMWAL